MSTTRKTNYRFSHSLHFLPQDISGEREREQREAQEQKSASEVRIRELETKISETEGLVAARDATLAIKDQDIQNLNDRVTKLKNLGRSLKTKADQQEAELAKLTQAGEAASSAGDRTEAQAQQIAELSASLAEAQQLLQATAKAGQGGGDTPTSPQVTLQMKKLQAENKKIQTALTAAEAAKLEAITAKEAAATEAMELRAGMEALEGSKKQAEELAGWLPNLI